MRALSLEYHDVVEPDAFDASGFPGAGPGSYKLLASDFDRHLDAIAASIPRPAVRAIDWLASPGHDRPLFITFDDGGVSAYDRIAAALERRGWRGHFFVTSGRIGTSTFLSAGQIRELSARGHVIGTHSQSHPARMGACSPERVLEEWTRSVSSLADILGEPVLTGSVPGGFYTRMVAEMGARTGLRVLFTSAPTTRCHTVDGCHVVGRYTLRRWSRAEAAGALASGRLAPRSAQWALYTGLNLARTLAGDHYTRLRQRYWAGRA
jgi:peptidoglycan/xylan/chitin deacetylase (PgdA/CDA1 family)